MSESMYFALGGAFFGFVASFTILSKDWAVMVAEQPWRIVRKTEMRMRRCRPRDTSGNKVVVIR